MGQLVLGSSDCRHFVFVSVDNYKGYSSFNFFT